LPLPTHGPPVPRAGDPVLLLPRIPRRVFPRAGRRTRGRRGFRRTARRGPSGSPPSVAGKSRWRAPSRRSAIMTAGRVPLVDPGEVLPYVDNEAVLEGRVEEIRTTIRAGPPRPRGSVVSCRAAQNRFDWVPSSVHPESGPIRFRFRRGFVPSGGCIPCAGWEIPVRSRGSGRRWRRGPMYAFSADAGRRCFSRQGGGRSPAEPVPAARRGTGKWVRRVAGTTKRLLYLLSLVHRRGSAVLPPDGHACCAGPGWPICSPSRVVNVAIFHILAVFLLRSAMWAARKRHGAPDLNLPAAAPRAAGVLGVRPSGRGSHAGGPPRPGCITVAILLLAQMGRSGARIAWTGMLTITLLVSPMEIVSPSLSAVVRRDFFLIANCGHPVELKEGKGGWKTRTAWWMKEAVRAAGRRLPRHAAGIRRLFPAVPSVRSSGTSCSGPVLGTAGVAGAAVAVVGRSVWRRTARTDGPPRGDRG